MNATEQTGIAGYYPEMGEERPEAPIDASLSHYGRHYFLRTPLVLSGRGIKYIDTYKASDLHPQAQHKVGWHRYQVTMAAFERIKATHRVAMEILL